MPQSLDRKRILFIYNGRTRFTKIDLALLREYCQVTELYLQRTNYKPLYITQQVQTHDLIFGWFASWHTLLPILLARRWGKPAIVVVGGYDTANMPEIGYGSQRGGLRRLIARSVIHNATHLLPFSYSAREELLSNTGVDPYKVTVIYMGVPDIAVSNGQNRDRLALTVGGVWQENLYRKGLLPFVQAAHYLPDIQFILVGHWFDHSIRALHQAASTNITFTGFMPDEELAVLYGRAAVYVQASQHEGFGMSVAEAMLRGCIPVVSQSGSLPEVVGNTGIYLASTSPVDIAIGIRAALNSDNEHRNRARERVLSLFSLEQRRQAIQKLLVNCLTA